MILIIWRLVYTFTYLDNIIFIMCVHLQYKCFKPCPKFRKNCSMKTVEHTCPKRCFEECPDCEIIVKKQKSCSHYYNIKCCADVEAVVCEKPCKKILACGHQCKSKCYQECEACKTKVCRCIDSHKRYPV